MLFGHDEGKNLKQLCDGLKDLICIAMGGTGADNAEDARKNLGIGGVATEDVLPVSKGGTGKTTHTANAVITGNGGNAVKNVPSASGAFYATGANAAPQFGKLPIAQGGTGADTAAGARQNIGAAPSYTYGTEDLTAGTSALETGKLYFVYE